MPMIPIKTANAPNTTNVSIFSLSEEDTDRRAAGDELFRLTRSTHQACGLCTHRSFPAEVVGHFALGHHGTDFRDRSYVDRSSSKEIAP